MPMYNKNIFKMLSISNCLIKQQTLHEGVKGQCYLPCDIKRLLQTPNIDRLSLNNHCYLAWLHQGEITPKYRILILDFIQISEYSNTIATISQPTSSTSNQKRLYIDYVILFQVIFYPFFPLSSPHPPILTTFMYRIILIIL